MPKKRKIIWYHPDLKEQARELRSNLTYSEKLLWNRIKGKQMKGYDFHRQKPLNHFIVDFFCNELLLAIELDGPIHQSEEYQMKDMKRQEVLAEYGIKFLRFTDAEIKSNLNKVVVAISEWIDE